MSAENSLVRIYQLTAMNFEASAQRLHASYAADGKVVGLNALASCPIDARSSLLVRRRAMLARRPVNRGNDDCPDVASRLVRLVLTHRCPLLNRFAHVG